MSFLTPQNTCFCAEINTSPSDVLCVWPFYICAMLWHFPICSTTVLFMPFGDTSLFVNTTHVSRVSSRAQQQSLRGNARRTRTVAAKVCNVLLRMLQLGQLNFRMHACCLLPRCQTWEEASSTFLGGGGLSPRGRASHLQCPVAVKLKELHLLLYQHTRINRHAVE